MVMLAVVTYYLVAGGQWFATDIVKPAVDGHLELMDDVVESSKKQTDILEELREAAKQNLDLNANTNSVVKESNVILKRGR